MVIISEIDFHISRSHLFIVSLQESVRKGSARRYAAAVEKTFCLSIAMCAAMPIFTYECAYSRRI